MALAFSTACSPCNAMGPGRPPYKLPIAVAAIPQCAMALQGEQAVENAKAIGGKNARERDYIATVEVFYKGADTLDYGARVRAYANALKQLHRKYPEDREAETFYAYALSALGTPTDRTFTHELRGAAILEKLYAELPDHPGVLHYLLHAYDNTPYASR